MIPKAECGLHHLLLESQHITFKSGLLGFSFFCLFVGFFGLDLNWNLSLLFVYVKVFKEL